ncbi:hypothetical protein AVEN_30417-1 [Araneus ventricosus]|uniref:Uncharacterized protein n=1 Tax=Araneus ventricosus TaxID=182803 RepID=A0A4Y2NXR7_ARAVE|nr:hypothetical protein AVEN_30417-1 [Araneus ventricosus]
MRAQFEVLIFRVTSVRCCLISQNGQVVENWRSASRTEIRTTDLKATEITVDHQDDNHEVERPTDWPVQTDDCGGGGYDSKGYAKMKRLIKGYASEIRLRTPVLDHKRISGRILQTSINTSNLSELVCKSQKFFSADLFLAGYVTCP